ncbi:MAG: phytanoyl-CoA dioxygenase family protein [Gammaproteobacteria bacterium]
MKELQARFSEDGVVCVRGALDRRGIDMAEAAFNWTLAHPGPGAREVLGGRPGAFYQDHANPHAFAAYRALLCDTGLADLVAKVINSESLWLLYEQIWLKEGAETLPTPWHQDLPYVPLEGDHLATLWLNLDPVAGSDSLEFVPGSHRGPLFNPTAFDPNDPSAAMFADGIWPPFPDIEATRDTWPIVCWAIDPGDVVIFHPAILHGGAATVAGGRRRTISLRYFGDHAFCAERPEQGVADVDRLRREDGGRDPIEAMALKPPGTLFRHPGFPRLR